MMANQLIVCPGGQQSIHNAIILGYAHHRHYRHHPKTTLLRSVSIHCTIGENLPSTRALISIGIGKSLDMMSIIDFDIDTY